MADNIDITPGTGKTVATDDCTTGHVQLVKLTYSADGDRTHVTADANGLRVAPISGQNGVAGGAGAVGATVQRTTLASDDPAVTALQIMDDWDESDRCKVNPISGQAGVAAGAGAVGATVQRVTLASDDPAVAELAVSVSTMNASSSDGATALTSTVQAIKASAGKLRGYYIYNPNSAAVFVQFYNTASGSVTVGTTNPLFMLTIPALSAANLWLAPAGVNFGTAISWAATSTAGGNGAPSTALDAVAWYS
jgi:hypothetical protein